MTLLTALARVKADTTGRAERIKMVRHVHLSQRPLALVFASLAGEACAPVAAMVGTDRDSPRLLVVYEPRNRTARFQFAAELAAIMLPYLASYLEQAPDEPTPSVPQDRGERPDPLPDAPQLLVPNVPTAAFLRLLGRSTRFRKTTGEYAVPAAVPLLGHWLTYFAERTEVSSSALLLSVTAALADHWATGQSATEDGNLAALLGWIDPPPGSTGHEAARAAEDPIRVPPAGPTTDPTFDKEVLEPVLQAIREATLTAGTALAGTALAGTALANTALAGTALANKGLADTLLPANGRLDRAKAAMDHALRDQLQPTWDLLWHGIDLLQTLPEAAHVPRRWLADRWSFTGQAAWLRDGGTPQPKRDSAVSAARRLARLEREQQRYDAARAYDDPLVMAEYRMTGEAFAGTVTAAEPDRVVNPTGKRPVLRPTIVVTTADPVLFEPDATLTSPTRPTQTATVLDVTVLDVTVLDVTVLDVTVLDARIGDAPGRGASLRDGAPHGTLTQVTLELSGGMGRKLTPQPDSVPALGDAVTYTSVKDGYQHNPKFPAPENTPWTHGGPPQAFREEPAANVDARNVGNPSVGNPNVGNPNGAAPPNEDAIEAQFAGLTLEQFQPEAYVPTDADANEPWS